MALMQRTDGRCPSCLPRGSDPPGRPAGERRGWGGGRGRGLDILGGKKKKKEWRREEGNLCARSRTAQKVIPPPTWQPVSITSVGFLRTSCFRERVAGVSVDTAAFTSLSLSLCLSHELLGRLTARFRRHGNHKKKNNKKKTRLMVVQKKEKKSKTLVLISMAH